MAIDRELLKGRWLHSHEEDEAGTRVYRPSSYSFPRSRGRAGIELHADGTLIQTDPGPTDAKVSRPGSWSLDGDTLILEVPGQLQRRIHVTSLDRDRMVFDG
jgi:hypothetical protein